ncbi:ferredoxin reductase [Hydrogenophaga sp.]|uniref:ferredoxin reductase n=1 Tax=Hydrogenophaga sp. TaxID=1904254 RepID=UPI003F70A226
MTHSLRIHAVRYAADGVLLFDLRHPEELELPGFEPGAHIDLNLPEERIRSYSLINDPAERHRDQIGVRRAPDGRGGSARMHDFARVGERIQVGTPRNHFALQEGAHHSTLVAGGIGITPLWSMLRRLERIERPWHLNYRCSSRASAAFLAELSQPWRQGQVTLSFSDEGAPRFDWERLVNEVPPGGHLYCCGPRNMIESFQMACKDLDPARVHIEHFTAAPDNASTKVSRSCSRAVAPGSGCLPTRRC